MTETGQTLYEQKRVTITSKRQFTIPQKFYTELGFAREAVCTVQGGALVIRPVRLALSRLRSSGKPALPQRAFYHARPPGKPC